MSVQEQDALRSQRQFISAISGLFGIPDQSYAGADQYAVNNPGRYQSINPTTGAYASEGGGVLVMPGGLTVGPMLLLAGLAAVAFVVFKR